MCIDYRPLNRRTEKEVWPTPDVASCLRKVKDATWFSAIDLKAGYHNIPIDVASRRYTGFVTQDGAFQWARMPFGPSSAPGHF